jgi:hypothetical protein
MRLQIVEPMMMDWRMPEGKPEAGFCLWTDHAYGQVIVMLASAPARLSLHPLENPPAHQEKVITVSCHQPLGGKGGIMLREFYVTCRVEKWFVDEGTESHGPYLSQHDAIADAIEAAQQLAKPKKAINVLLKLRGSSAELIWSSKKPSASIKTQDRKHGGVELLETEALVSGTV